MATKPVSNTYFMAKSKVLYIYDVAKSYGFSFRTENINQNNLP